MATRVSRLRAAEAAGTSTRKVELIASIASLQASVERQRAELAADESVLASLVSELLAIERGDTARARAIAPGPGLYMTMGEACDAARCNEATMRKKLRANPHLGWRVDRRWKISRPELVAHLAALDG